MSLRRLLLGLIVAAVTAHRAANAQAPSPADLETARALFKEGRELRAQGDLPGAVRKLEAAHAAGRTPVTGVELARTYAMTGQLVEAREVALAVARIEVAADETERSAEARRDAAKLADELRDRIPVLTVQLLHAPEGSSVRVTVDGEALPPALLGQPMRLNPTSHLVVVRTANGVETRETVVVAEHESRLVTIDLPATGAAPIVEASREVDAPSFVFGAAFALVPQIYLPARDAPEGTHAQGEVTAGLGFELGSSLTSSFDVLLRGLLTIGQRGSPASELFALGPGAAFRATPHLWLGASLYGGRARMKLDAHEYGTDWVFLATADIGFAVIDWPSGQWLFSVEPGYYFASDKDNPVFLLPVMFGFRSF